MPTQDNNNQNPTLPPTVSSPSISTQSDVPPMPDYMNVGATPTNPAIVTPPPKKKFGGGKIIATILGILVLIGGVGAGIFLVGQNQNISEKASGELCVGEFGGRCVATTTTCTGGVQVSADCTSTQKCYVGGTCGLGGVCVPGHEISCPTSNNNPGTKTCNADGQGYGECVPNSGGGGTTSCTPLQLSNAINFNGSDIRIDQDMIDKCNAVCTSSGEYLYGNKYTCAGINLTQCNDNGQPINQSFADTETVPIGNVTCGTVQIDVGCRTSGNTYGPVAYSRKTAATACGSSTNPPSTNTASCTNIKAYNTSWAILTNAQLTQLTAGTTVNFCVTGETSGGNFDKARFTVNGVSLGETTTQRPGSNDYCDNYAIPAGTTTFNVQGEIHHTTLNWR